MSFEQITQPIRTENLENHERIVEKNMLSLQLEYADRLASGLIPNIKGVKEHRAFLGFIDQYSYIKEYSFNLFMKKANIKDDVVYSELIQNIFRKIDQLHNGHKEDWIDQAQKVIEDEVGISAEKVNKKTSVEIEKKKEDTHEKNKAGIISFNPNVNRSPEDTETIKLLKLNPENDYISIHLGDMFKQKAKGEADITLTPSLQKLATIIIEKYPETQAIIARSWLVDTPYGVRMGLQNIEREKEISHLTSFWGQFIDQNGQFNKERISQLMDTGKPPFYLSHGQIPILDFLKKYLPQEKKGTIALKELRPGFYEKYNNDITIINNIKKDWANIDQKEIEKRIESCVLVPEFENFIDGIKITSLSEILSECKEQGLTMDEAEKSFKVSTYVSELRLFLDKYKYITKEYSV